MSARAAVFAPRPDTREAEVWRKLSGVTDPELDDPVTDMGFVRAIEIEAGDVVVRFRLPTFWCAPNFAFIMGEDMRAAVLGLDWVTSCSVVLDEHMYVDNINRGVNEGLTFKEAFGAEATADLDEIRRTFLVKAFQWRQEALLRHLLDKGISASELMRWTIADLGRHAPAGTCALTDRYLNRRHVAGSFDSGSLAFVTSIGGEIIAKALPDYLRSIRRIRTNAEFNGALCRRLLVERSATEPASWMQPEQLTNLTPNESRGTPCPR